MHYKKPLVVTFILYFLSFIIVFTGCATRPKKENNYRYYVLDLQAKTLNGPTPEDDQSLQSCWDVNGENPHGAGSASPLNERNEVPLSAGKYKCIVMFTDQYYKMKEEFDDMRLRDNICQKYMNSGDH